MSLREHLRELRPHAEWWAIEKLREKLGEWIAESVVIAIVLTIAQKIRGIPFDWWVLGTLFVVSFGFLAYSYRRDRRQQVAVVPEVVSPPLPPVSSQDAGSREKIAVLFHSSVDQAGRKLQEAMTEMFQQMDRAKDEKGVRDERILVIAQLARHGVYISCMDAFVDLGRALGSQGEVDLSTLQQRLVWFFIHYQLLVRWMYKLANFSPRGLHNGNSYTIWMDHHKRFHEKLRELLATEEFSEVRKQLEGHWQDTFS